MGVPHYGNPATQGASAARRGETTGPGRGGTSDAGAAVAGGFAAGDLK